MTLGVLSPAAARAATLGRLANERFDLLIVGGGATGAAIARDAALRGLAVALCEAGDFAGQTSSRSSKLIHGGLRYLQYGDLALVFEALAERRRLIAVAPHLCRPLEFIFPAYRRQRPGLRALGAGIALYNALALWRPPVSGRRLSPTETYLMQPALRTAGLQGAQLYTDCQTDDARLVLETVLDARIAGAAVASYVRVTGLRRDRAGRVIGAAASDVESGASFDVRAELVVNATGPFSDSFDRGRHHLRPTLGVHLVVDADRLPHGGRAVVLRSPRDGRVVFSLPAGRRTILGTTDTDWARPGPPRLEDEVRARGGDVEYLLETANHAFPPARLGPDDVISTFAALRPLIAGDARTPSATSREHEIYREPDGVLTVAGGKLTTYRRMAEEAVDHALEVLRDRGREAAAEPCRTGERPLPGAGPAPALTITHELAPDVERRMREAYGTRATAVLAAIDDRPDLARRIDPELPYLWAEVVHAARQELVVDLEDVLVRRIPLLRDARDQGLRAAEQAARLIAPILGWSPSRRAAALARYRDTVETSRRWRADRA